MDYDISDLLYSSTAFGWGPKAAKGKCSTCTTTTLFLFACFMRLGNIYRNVQLS